MKLPRPRTPQEISDATRRVIKSFGPHGFLSRARAEIHEVNFHNPVNGKTTIFSSRLSHVVNKKGNFRKDNAKLAENWLLERYPRAFLLPLNSLHVNIIQQFFGVTHQSIDSCKDSLKGTFTAIRDHGPYHKDKFLVSKFEFLPNISTGSIAVREEFTTELEGQDGVAQYSWEGVCFPMGQFFYVMMREHKTNEELPHIKFMILSPNKGHKNSIYQLCGHYLLGLNGIDHVRHTNIFMLRNELNEECYVNPVQSNLLDEDLIIRMNKAIERVALLED